ncbi:MAG: hypothetical protein PHU46_12170 [Rhodocyclaceae bacterium]|nr:hypothetical protein [Rhodocyclaceae bacterium]
MAKKEQPAQPEQTVVVTALNPVRHDGSDYAPGDEFDMRESCVASLVAVGAISVSAPAPAPAA